MATSHLAATLVQEVPADSGNFPWYMTDSTAVLEDSYSEVVVNVIDLALNWQLFSRAGGSKISLIRQFIIIHYD